MARKIAMLVAAGAVAAAMGIPSVGFSQTGAQAPDVVAFIKQLQAQIADLQAQLNQLKSELGAEPTPTPTPTPSTLTLTRPLKRGDRGDDVRALQEFLSRQSSDIYPEKLITGYFGPLTEEAVKRWQTSKNIDPLGIVGPKTTEALQKTGGFYQSAVPTLIQEGAGSSGKIPPGLLTAPGIQNKLTTQTGTSTGTTTPPSTPPPTLPPSTTATTSTSTPPTTPPPPPSAPSGAPPPAPPGTGTSTPPASLPPSTPPPSPPPPGGTGTSTSPTPPTDTTAPVISNIQTNASSTAATISWTTDEPADTQVEYGLTSSYGSASVLYSSLISSHVVSIGDLTGNTTYHFRIKSKDAAGNLAINADQTVTTLASAPSPLPAPTYIRAEWAYLWWDIRDNTMGQKIAFDYPTTGNEKTTVFRLYRKLPGEGSFSVAAEFSGLDSTSCSGTGTFAVGEWLLAPGSSCGSWIVYRIKSGFTNPYAYGATAFPASSYAVGEHIFYVAAVSSAGIEGTASLNSKLTFLQPLTIISPTAAQSPVSTTPIFQWTASSDWPVFAPQEHVVIVFDSPSANNPFWVTQGYAGTSKIYDGGALSSSKTYRTSVFGITSANFPAGDPAGPGWNSYLVLPSAVTDFTVSASSTAAAPNLNQLATILQAITGLLDDIVKLLAGLAAQ